jgi:uncharacterized protein (TIGR02453 family)
MLQEKTLGFIKGLAENNNKAWFDKHRDEYETAKEDFETFVTALIEHMSKSDPSFAGQKAKDSIFRIYRDVRFSKDKTPYKVHLSAGFSKGGKKFPGAGYYLHIEPGKSMAGGGLWMPDGPLLKAVRQEIDYNFKEFKQIIGKPSFKKLFDKIEGDQLKTLPQGYTADNPAIDYLKMKSFVVSHTIEDKDITGKTSIKKVGDVFAAMKPFVDFMNKSLD